MAGLFTARLRLACSHLVACAMRAAYASCHARRMRGFDARSAWLAREMPDDGGIKQTF